MDFAEAKQVLSAFERAGVRYVLVGSMAMAVQGLVRATRGPQDRVDAAALRQRFNLEEG